MTTKLERTTPASLSGNPRATLAAWQKYEPIVISALRVHPKPFVYPCTTLRPVTICSRLRDAVRGKIAFDYPSELSTADVIRWYSEVVFKYDVENVYIGPVQNVKDVLEGSGVQTNSSHLVFPTLSFEEITAFSLLLSNGKLLGPVIVKVPPDLTLLPERENLEMVKKEDGSLMLL